MDIKKATNSQLSTTESKTKQNKKNPNKVSKQPEQEQNHTYGDHLEGYPRRGKAQNGGKHPGITKHKW